PEVPLYTASGLQPEAADRPGPPYRNHSTPTDPQYPLVDPGSARVARSRAHTRYRTGSIRSSSRGESVDHHIYCLPIDQSCNGACAPRTESRTHIPSTGTLVRQLSSCWRRSCSFQTLKRLVAIFLGWHVLFLEIFQDLF